MMENKYYTPSIEEFHVGFEYQYTDNSNMKPIWRNQVFELNDDAILLYHYIENNQIRVKYLDKEDIEELGWEYGEYSYMGRENELYELYNIPDTMIYTIRYITEDSSTYIFNGTVKNKNEFKKLMKQLDIL